MQKKNDEIDHQQAAEKLNGAKRKQVLMSCATFYDEASFSLLLVLVIFTDSLETNQTTFLKTKNNVLLLPQKMFARWDF